ncbi:MAG TPA: glycerophosphodiester phosphodiesterase family protein [Solirubrobacterales bacterium]
MIAVPRGGRRFIHASKTSVFQALNSFGGAALRHTLTGPVEGLETDVCLTADDRLVLLHDPLLTLGTTLDGWARQRTAEEIRSALIRDSAGEPTAEHPLLLEELIDLVPEAVGLQLEVKAHADPALARRTAEALCKQLRGSRSATESR